MRFNARASSEPTKPAAPVRSITESEVRAGVMFVSVLGTGLAWDDGSRLSMGGSSSVSSADARKRRLSRRRSVSVNAAAAVIDVRGFRRAMVDSYPVVHGIIRYHTLHIVL